jgi:hypothetical protein
MIKASDIRSSIGEFLGGDRNFDEFENWLIGHTWNIHKFGDVESQVLAYSVELRIAEFNADALSLSELRLELQNIANTFLLNPNQSDRVISASSTFFNPVPWPVQPAGRPHEGASESPVPR